MTLGSYNINGQTNESNKIGGSNGESKIITDMSY
jgi:hypothetical protein